MRILHVMAGAKEGGAEYMLLESALALAEADIEQHIVTRANNTFRLSMLEQAGISTTIASFNKIWPFSTKKKIRQAIQAFKPDIIQYWMGRAGEFAPAEYKKRSVGWYGGYYKIQRFVNCDWHVGVSLDLLRHIREQGADYTRSAAIHTHATFEDVTPIDRHSLDTPEDAPVALALARLHEKKGLDTLLDAAAKIPGLYVWIAGDGPIENELRAHAYRLGLNDRVRFLGWRNDRGALLAACDIVAFPSRYEPFGTVTVDAWASKRPLIAADAAGPAAYVRDGINGLLIPKNNPDALANAIKRILEDPDLAKRLVKGGTEAYEHQFTKAAYTRDALEFYNKIIQYAGHFEE